MLAGEGYRHVGVDQMSRSLRGSDVLVGVLGGVVILSAVLPASWREALAYQRDDFHWYQLLTANVVHEGTYHLLLNLVALLLVTILARRLMSSIQLMLCLMLSLIVAVFAEHALSQPPFMAVTIAETRGLSGGIHGLFAASMVLLAAARDRIALLVLVALVIKVSVEAVQGEAVISSGTVELVAVMGHFGGTVSGLAFAAALVRSRIAWRN